LILNPRWSIEALGTNLELLDNLSLVVDSGIGWHLLCLRHVEHRRRLCWVVYDEVVDVVVVNDVRDVAYLFSLTSVLLIHETV
jgi:hypothetical protein